MNVKKDNYLEAKRNQLFRFYRIKDPISVFHRDLFFTRRKKFNVSLAALTMYDIVYELFEQQQSIGVD